MIPVSEVPAYLKEHYNYEVVRQTVYNWIKVGVCGVRLKLENKRPKLVTVEALESFLQESGVTG